MDSKLLEQFKNDLCKENYESPVKLDRKIVDQILDGKILDSSCIDSIYDYIMTFTELLNDYEEKSFEIIFNYMKTLNTPITNIILYYFSNDYHYNKNDAIDFLVNIDITKDDHLFKYLCNDKLLTFTDVYELLVEFSKFHKKNEKLEQENEIFKKEIEKLKTELLYQPGGQGMLDAKSNFESLSKK
jgi:hypothetical protein